MRPRKFTEFATQEIKNNLNILISEGVSVPEYQEAMKFLGRELGKLYSKTDEELLIVSTSEDADYLTSGYISALEENDIPFKIAVFWNHHYSLNNGSSVAPITNRYIQNNFESCTNLVLLKSIISGSCVIRTNLLALLDSLNPDTINSIFIAAPVMHKNGEDGLKKEFPPFISEKFQFHTFAIDEEKDTAGNVLDGIGGEVYPHLGLSSQPALISSGYIPNLVYKQLFG